MSCRNNQYKPKLTKKKNVYCAPSNRGNKHTCFSKKSLLKIAKEFNKNNVSNNNASNNIEFNRKDKIKDLWNKINGKLNDNCRGEWCWIQQQFVKGLNDDEINSTFRPETPLDWYNNKIEWLSTIDIDNVMQQYEGNHNDFSFIGPVPMDFDSPHSMGGCVVDELCKIDIGKMLKKKKKKIGIVFNLDKHYESGSHWVAMYVDLNKNYIYYWDSYAEPAATEVDNLAKRIQQQGKKLGRKIRYKKNNIRHQFKNSECGVYCMYFITKLLQGKTFNDIVKNKISDDDMNLKRGYFYTPSCQ